MGPREFVEALVETVRVSATIFMILIGAMVFNSFLAISTIPMELSLNADDTIKFIGRVASRMQDEQRGHQNYDIGIEFTDLTDQDKTLLKAFVDYLAKKHEENNE